jgi:hypothetical protein
MSGRSLGNKTLDGRSNNGIRRIPAADAIPRRVPSTATATDQVPQNVCVTRSSGFGGRM